MDATFLGSGDSLEDKSAIAGRHAAAQAAVENHQNEHPVTSGLVGVCPCLVWCVSSMHLNVSSCVLWRDMGCFAETHQPWAVFQVNCLRSIHGIPFCDDLPNVEVDWCSTVL